MNGNSDYPDRLQKLFPGHPARRLLCTGVYTNELGEDKKEVTTVYRGARPGNYAEHLSVGSIGGRGALGVIPTYPEEFGGRTCWLVLFLALDFDHLSLAEVMPLVAALEEYRVYVYLDRGTTGRGVHLYIFLSSPLPQREAHEVLTTIANLSLHIGLPYPEFMPSSASGSGKGIFLPYRGAAEDGIGANPLIDPYGTQIPLGAANPDAAESEIFRTEVEDLKSFVENLGVADTRTTASCDTSHILPTPGTYAGGIEAWDAEMARLKEVWVKTRRQYLALGASAYGIRSLGISADRIKSSIEALEKASSDPEVDQRMKAVDRTVEKHVKGERVAWVKFYNLAGVEPPKSNKVVPYEVIIKLHILEDRLSSALFKGMGGFTDLDVLYSLIEVGRKYGKPHAEGVEVSISVRDLAEFARVGSDTVIKSLRRLGQSGLVKRGSRGKGTNSGSLVLLIDDEDVASHNMRDEDEDGNADEQDIHLPRFRWGAGKIGKTSRPILQILQRLQPCTRVDVAKAMGRKSNGIRNPMNRLWEQGLVVYDEETNTYTLPYDLQDRLFEVQFNDGTLETNFKHKKRFERERKAFRTMLSIKRAKGREKVQSR
jgi:hypothetical protein